jgi:hypothetical protein
MIKYMETNLLLRTRLKNFRFDAKVQTDIYLVEWFRYDLDENTEENIRPFNHSELEKFQGYAVPNAWNFGGGKDYLITNQNEAPTEVMDDLVPNERIKYPECLILIPKADIRGIKGVSAFMKIALIDEQGRDRDDYNLPFGVIGRIIEKL